MKKTIPIILLVLLALMAAWSLHSNIRYIINTQTIESERLPEEFNGFRIAQLSDMHHGNRAAEDKKLLKNLRELKPDIIVFTGDLIHDDDPNIDAAVDFLRKAAEIAPCYYVIGNHEVALNLGKSYFNRVREAGVTLLLNEYVELTKGDGTIRLIGVSDPMAAGEWPTLNDVVMKSILEPLSDTDDFKLLLSHRPELMDVYAGCKMDLVLAGHAHGAQFNLPWLGGLYAPGQGLFPKYYAGLYAQGDTRMLVSRGLCKLWFAPRLNNPREMLIIELASLQ